MSEYATRGKFAKAYVSKSGISGDGVDFFRYGLDVCGYVPVFDGASIGARSCVSFTGGPVVPPYKYLYFGYNERIRGHFDTISEGENIIGASTEFRIPVISPRHYTFPYAIIPELSVWRYGVFVSVFVDAGKTWFRTEGFEGRKWQAGVGASVDLLLPYSIVVREAYALGDGGNTEVILDFGTAF